MSIYCGDKDSIEHSFIECAFTKLFTQSIVNWLNQVNECQISPNTPASSKSIYSVSNRR